MVTMIRMTVAALLAAGTLLPAAAADRREAREVAPFSALGLSAPIRVELALGERDAVVLEGDEKALADIETVVKDGALEIRLKPGVLRLRQHDVRAQVTARRIGALSVAGSGDIVAPALHGETLQVSIAGSGDVVVGGQVQSLGVHIAGSGDLRAARLQAQRVSISIAGSGDATVWAREALAVQVAGSGDVRYYGAPTLAKALAGSGSVERLGAAPS